MNAVAKVVLFDIDGTLLTTNGAGRRAMEAALAVHFGTAGPSGHRYDGKTDPQIARDLMRQAGFADADINERLPAVFDHYLRGLRAELASAPEALRVYVGVTELLDALGAREEVLVGLLTGNIEHGAAAKLDAAQIGVRRFRTGAFGSDNEHRAQLPAIAQARASALLGRAVEGRELVIIGDTPSDMTCGRGVGARAIGVATGGYDVHALTSYEPVAVFENFGDTARVVEVIVDA